MLTALQQNKAMLSELRVKAKTEHVPVISTEVEEFLTKIIKDRNPNRILEVGTGIGYSAIMMAINSPDARITTLELIEKRFTEAIKNFKAFNLSTRIELIEGNARETLKNLSAGKVGNPKDEDNVASDSQGEYDFIFVDAAKSHYKEMFNEILRLGKKDGCIVVFDNIFLEGRTLSDDMITHRRDKTSARNMREFLKYIEESDFGSEVHEMGDGILVVYI